MTDIIQTVAIVITLGFSYFQWRKTAETLKIDNYSRIISALNDIRRERLSDPNLERQLFDGRSQWTDDQIKTRVYAVMMANLFEWSLLSYKADLIDKKCWLDWRATWKNVILSDKNLSKLMLDKTIYTFNYDAQEEIAKIVKEIEDQISSS